MRHKYEISLRLSLSLSLYIYIYNISIQKFLLELTSSERTCATCAACAACTACANSRSQCARNGCSGVRGSGAALALENAVRARFGATSAGVDSALEKAVRACFGAAPASAFEKALRVCCLRSLFESAGLGYTVLCAPLLGSPCSVHGYARVHSSISIQMFSCGSAGLGAASGR